MKDNYGREISYLRLSVTEKCNLRCRYCMPEEGVCQKRHEDMLREEEMIQAVEAAASLGIRKIRITGGEPLVKKNIVSICEKVSQIEGIMETCLTTNGTLLPKLAKPLWDAGVSRLNISLDTLDKNKYKYITRRDELDKVFEGIETALKVGYKRIKINTVLIGGFNDDEIADLANLTRRYPVDVRFIELMPMWDNVEFGPQAYVPCSRVLEVLPELTSIEKGDGVAQLYKLPNAMGNIGLISPISSHFCESCNRIRLTADGKLKPCLHSSQEYSIKGMNYEGMVKTMQETILAKPSCHVPLSAEEHSEAGRSMNQIGG
ncbi:MAG: GTP 3',8-cyclase MoaA [Eubacterium sp.]|nr:GTP 3',8-cyclase MoaA [Eubacterium sp.]